MAFESCIRLSDRFHARYLSRKPFPSQISGPVHSTLSQKPIHSHNDYWRATPLYTAISFGAISVEADVFWINDTLYVGHDMASLTPERTLQSLYIQPLLKILERQSPGGVYDVDPGQTLYLWIDVKTEGKAAWPHVVKSLQPLRERNALSAVGGESGLVWRQITVIGTGNAPYDEVLEKQTRDYFVDTDVKNLEDPPAANHISPFASASLRDAVGDIGPLGLTPEQLDLVKGQIGQAQWRGIQVRYWDTPVWPKKLRNIAWRQLVDVGVGLLNVDDLHEAANNNW
jgi:hypothetical protein